ncbi:uncharacterized protein [Diabrotica undecimpunctata]|uniref:uncharacterized protein isoform X1 n=1 Tax=Diabrotica undecimpunctata TaxID=50387 RepID=UPI003B6337C1
MQYLIKCTVLGLLIPFSVCWDDYTDYYYDDYDLPKTINIITDVGKKVHMTCEEGYFHLVTWQHNHDEVFYPDASKVINIDWRGEYGNMWLTIITEEDGGIWECSNYKRLIVRYNIIVNPIKEPSTDDTTKISPTTTVLYSKVLYTKSTPSLALNPKENERTTITLPTSTVVNNLQLTVKQKEEYQKVSLHKQLHNRKMVNMVQEKEAGMLVDESVKIISDSLKNPYLRSQKNMAPTLLNTPCILLFIVFYINIFIL